jgi:hypothetical protein
VVVAIFEFSFLGLQVLSVWHVREGYGFLLFGGKLINGYVSF